MVHEGRVLLFVTSYAFPSSGFIEYSIKETLSKSFETDAIHFAPVGCQI